MESNVRTERWDPSSIEDMTGKVVLVTGASSGIGLGTATSLAANGATVVLGARSESRATDARARITASAPNAVIEVLLMDLASLNDTHRAATEFLTSHQRLDLLINNAGVMVPPYGQTADGFELQIGTNHLGHFALTGLLLDRLLATPQSRIVTVSSVAHRSGRIRFDDLQSERHYRAGAAYGQSKLANLMFTYLLQSKLDASRADTISLAAHPGWARTDLQRHVAARWWWKAARWLEPVFSQSADAGALPTLRAATDPTAKGGEYYGPSGFMQGKGSPVRVQSSARSLDREVQERLWEVSEKLTGVAFTALR